MSWSMTTRPLPEKRNDDDTFLSGFDEVPLFMKTLPGDETENVALSALQDLVHGGTEDGGSSLPILNNDDFSLIRNRDCTQFQGTSKRVFQGKAI